MLCNKLVAVVVPVYNEQKQIKHVIETMPDFVDRIIVVNDGSIDGTLDIVKNIIENGNGSNIKINKNNYEIDKDGYNKAEEVLVKKNNDELKYFSRSEVLNKDAENEKIILINHLSNEGKGSAVSTGYLWCREHGIDCTAIMDGDGQMDPSELKSICMPVVAEGTDYVKGNRLIHRSAWLVIPKVRYLGNSILSILTKIASGYWRISDTQCGYTAISLKALQAIRLHNIYKSYGVPNDLLIKLNIAFCTIKEVEIKPVYNIGEQSKMRIVEVILPISWLLFISFFKRLWVKYLFRDFHPLFLLYNYSFLLGVIMIPYAAKIANLIFQNERISYETLLVFVFIATSGFQSLLFAMWMDMQDNERLYK